MHWASHSESAAKHNAPWCGVAGQYGRRLARAASVNIDCGRVATKSLPAWPEAPTFAWACGHGRIHSLQDPHMVGGFIRSVVGAASDWDAALDNVAAKCWTGGEIRVAAPLETWVDEAAKLAKPDRVVYCDGSEAEYQRMIAEMLRGGDSYALNEKTYPNCY